MTVGWVYHDDFLLHDTGAEHPESPLRLRTILRALEAEGLLSQLHPLRFKAAPAESLHRVHEPAYVSLVQQACAQGFTFIGSMETRICPASYDIAMLATGGVLEACDEVMAGRITRAFCAVRPPGHHALRDLAGGYCLFNNVAVAAEHLVSRHKLTRLAIVDFDVHHGNGTQDIFLQRCDVLYASIHAHPQLLYPGSGYAHETGQGPGEGFTLNIPMPPGAGDDDYRRAFDQKLLPVLRQFRPQFVLLSAGFDAVAEDCQGHINLQPQSFAWMTAELVRLADETCGGRLVSVLEGGYALQTLGKSAAAHVSRLIRS